MILTPIISVKQHLERYKPTYPILIAVSGGVDSMVLLHILRTLIAPQNIVVIHINHHLRTESDRDTELVKRVCNAYNIAFESYDIHIDEHKNIECTMRNKRLNIYNTVSIVHKTGAVWTAHHSTDLVETMLLKLTKGTGIKGLQAYDIHTKPLLYTTKKMIYDYARNNNIEWLEDASNKDNKYSRNRIRNSVMPHLELINSSLEEVFLREFIHIKDAYNYIQTMIPTDKSMHLKTFLELPDIIKTEWIRANCTTTPSSKELTDMLKWLTNSPMGSSQKHCGSTLWLYKNGILCS